MGKSGNKGVASLGATRVFPLFSFRLGSAHEIRVPPRHRPRGPGGADGHRPLPNPPTMVNPGPPRPPWSVDEALGTGAISAELATILTDHSRNVREDGEALLAEKILG